MRKIICKRLTIAVTIFIGVSVLPATAAVRLAAPFGEHMVLPQGVPVPIWGTGASGGDSVRLSFNGQSVTANSDWNGRWLIVLAPMQAGGPYQMLIEVGGRGPIIPSSAATVRGGAELNDVVVGEVRLMPRPAHASAQSGLAEKSSAQNASAQNSPAAKSGAAPGDGGQRSAWIRIYRGSPHSNGSPGASGQWVVAALDPTPGVSAESYSLGSELHSRLNIPVGVIEVDAYPSNPLSPNSTSVIVRSLKKPRTKSI